MSLKSDLGFGQTTCMKQTSAVFGVDDETGKA